MKKALIRELELAGGAMISYQRLLALITSQTIVSLFLVTQTDYETEFLGSFALSVCDVSQGFSNFQKHLFSPLLRKHKRKK